MSSENPVETLQRSLRDLLHQNAGNGRLVVAIDALDAAAATAFADAFAAAVAEDGTAAFRATLGDGADDVREGLVAPFRAGEPFEGSGTAAPERAVLVVDGRFLHASGLRGLWNWSVWLEANPPFGAPRPELPDAEKQYVRSSRPRAAASVIVENSDPAHPVQVFGDFC
jgi:uridine kinase